MGHLPVWSFAQGGPRSTQEQGVHVFQGVYSLLTEKKPSLRLRSNKEQEKVACARGQKASLGVPQSGQRRPLWGQDLPWAWKGRGEGTF